LQNYAVWRTPKIGELVNKLAEATRRARYFMIPRSNASSFSTHTLTLLIYQGSIVTLAEQEYLVSEAKFLDGLWGEQSIPGIDYRNKVWNLEQIFTQAHTVN
jgi:hypothetical protein